MSFNKFDFISSYGSFKQLPDTSFPEIVFAGRSNVGKSSLLNKLMQRKSLAHVSSTPGKTATINFYGDDKIRFVDLPGYGYAKVSKSEKQRWAKLLEGYFNSDRNIKLVVLLVDMRHKPSVDDMDMAHFLSHNNLPFIIVMTKSDKLKKTAYNKRMEEVKHELEEFSNVAIIPFSSVTGEGIDKVKREISTAL
ncbi:MAG TPA: ribosome biogenesis GTP-binding protein YihA/YsxC [Oscillospiraceae bacterium]|nr:ribosome biogenesis GTP-binding protein YihA/YsxC [Oscillospiraceae bacterium]